MRLLIQSDGVVVRLPEVWFPKSNTVVSLNARSLIGGLSCFEGTGLRAVGV